MAKEKTIAPGITQSGKIISIDFGQWATQKNYALETGKNESSIRVYVSQKKMESVYIPELRLTLVRRG